MLEKFQLHPILLMDLPLEQLLLWFTYITTCKKNLGPHPAK